jgi:hypothetical protein
MVYLLWCGEKILAGDELTPEEHDRFVECRQSSIGMARRMFGIKDEEFSYTPGEAFREP